MFRTVILLLSLVLHFGAFAGPFLPMAEALDPLKDYRFCGEPARAADGSIKRSSKVLNAFRKIHPCPVTGKIAGACPGWQMNHVIPLDSGGCDAVTNLDWMPTEIKTCSHPWCRDRWERTYYRIPHGIVTWTLSVDLPASSPP